MGDPSRHVMPSIQARVGTTLNEKWTLDSVLGVGGMAAVYAATHRNRSRAAIKVLHRELSVDGTIRERFLREGYIANSIDHPAVVPVLDDDVSEDGSAYLVMALLEGETLRHRWDANDQRLTFEEALNVADRVLEMLTVAHAVGVIHRDLKPDNIFLEKSGAVRVLDFGVARMRDDLAIRTETGHVLGTPAYMSPEQARGRVDEVDHRTDLWAVAAVVFFLVSGRSVRSGATPTEALVLAVTEPVASLKVACPAAPEALVAWVDRALAFEKDARFEDAAAMREALLRLRSSGPAPTVTMPGPMPVTAPEGEARVSSRAAFGAFAVGLLVVGLVCGVAALLFASKTDTAAPRSSASARSETPSVSAASTASAPAAALVQTATQPFAAGGATAGPVPSATPIRPPNPTQPTSASTVRVPPKPAPVPTDDGFERRR